MSNSRCWPRILLRQSGPPMRERCRLSLVFRPETSIDRRAENTDSDVQHVPVIGGLEPVLFGVRHRTLERRRLHSVSVPFDFDEVFDADYLFFYEPLFADVTEADVDAIWRLLML